MKVFHHILERTTLIGQIFILKFFLVLKNQANNCVIFGKIGRRKANLVSLEIGPPGNSSYRIKIAAHITLKLSSRDPC